MKIDLKKLLNARTEIIPFQGTCDLSAECFYGVYPFRQPVSYTGEITNRLGVLRLTGTIQATYHTVCARCLEPLEVCLTAQADTLLMRKEQTQDEEVFLLEDDTVEVEDVLIPALFLEIDMVYLCRPDCQGLCPHCGANRNITQCSCGEKQMDSRLAVLKTLLNHEQE